MTDTNPFQEIERAFGKMSQQFGVDAGSIPVDVVDAGETLLVHADLPGIDADNVEVSLHDGHELEITVTNEAYTEESDGRYVRRERRRESRSRTVSLPTPVDEGETTATYEDGVLTVRLGKRTSDEGTDIPVS